VTSPAESHYTLRRVQELLGMSRAVIEGLIEHRFVTPRRGPRNAWQFDFCDLMLLRTAYSLQMANIPPRKILASLKKLKEKLPEELPLTGLRLTAVGADVVVRDRHGDWAADSGQWLMDFEVAKEGATVSFLSHAPSAGQTAQEDADELVHKGQTLEEADPAAAEKAYRSAIRVAPHHEDAYLNLGALLCAAERFEAAVQIYAEGLAACPACAHLAFNRAIALEDLGDASLAMEDYRHCLALDPTFADAHFNLGRLLENLGDGRGAVRHFNAYRKLKG
jgi:tetratricopeptide (TPR) repeat protein